MKFCTLASGSNGNSSLLSCCNTHVLIDVGISNRAICTALNALCVSPDDISAVFITHEHYDHVKGLTVWAKNHLNCVYYAPHHTAMAILSRNPELHDRMIAFNPGDAISHGALAIKTVATPHDTDDSVSYRFEGNGKCTMIATDLGYVPDEVCRCLQGVDVLLIEANYDEKKLYYGSYPQMLKNRIASKNGHLSNDDCAECVLNAVKCGTKEILLGHLSEENNTPRLAYETVHRHLLDHGIIPGVDMQLRVAPRGMRGEEIVISKEATCSQSK